MIHVGTEQTRGALRATSLLESLPDEEIDGLAAHARFVHFEAGEQVFAKGSLGTHAYWVLEGRIRLTATARNGHELLLKMVDAGDHCGEVAAIEQGPRSSTATAETDVDAVSIKSRHLVDALERCPAAAMDVIRFLCAYLRQAVANIETVGLHSAETRIWCRLMDLSYRYPGFDGASRAIRIAHGFSQQALADSVGLTRVMVNRQLSEWRERGLIETGRGVIVIPDPEAFEAFVWRSPE
jgi:CRP/FNR family transcriptional regulator